MNRWLAAVVVTGLVLSACSDGDKAAPATSTTGTEFADGQFFSTDDYQGPELPLLAERETTSGYRVRIREFSWQSTSSPSMSGAGWNAPGWCFPTSQYRLTVTSDEMVGVLIGPHFSELNDGLAATAFHLGDADGAPTRAVVLQVDEQTATASVTWADGITDTADATDGWVLLVAPGGPDTDFTLTLEGSGGSRTVQARDLLAGDSPAWQKACTEPVADLPPAGSPPADAAAAERQIRSRFERLWNAEVPFETKGVDLLDDVTGVADALAFVPPGSYADSSGGTVHTLTTLVFTAPTEAWFTYDILSPVTTFVNRFGVVRLLDGVWKFDRAVICQDIALSGATCIPEAVTLVPPQD